MIRNFNVGNWVTKSNLRDLDRVLEKCTITRDVGNMIVGGGVAGILFDEPNITSYLTVIVGGLVVNVVGSLFQEHFEKEQNEIFEKAVREEENKKVLTLEKKD